jgi:putative ABC transport system substrate-binding protein
MAAFFGSLVSLARAAAPDVQVLLSSDVDYYLSVSSAITRVLKPHANEIILSTTVLSDKTDLSTISALVVAVGARACKESMNSQNPSPLLCTFLPYQNFKKTLQAYQKNKPLQQRASRQISAIYLDQPWERYFKLAKILVPKVKTVGMVFGPLSEQMIANVQKQASLFDITIEYDVLASDKTAADQLTPVFNNSQFFLATVNPSIITRTTAKWLLYYSIRNRKPVLAYSRAWVKAGALAAVYSSPEDTGQDIGEQLIDLFKKRPISLQEPRYPLHFSVITNPSVARSFDIRLADNDELKQRVNDPAFNSEEGQ